MTINPKTIIDKNKTGVLVVDIQGDFTEHCQGSLAVPGSDAGYLKVVDKATRTLKEKGFKVFASQDWHPENHMSFYTNNPGKNPFETAVIHGRDQIMWPPHCVRDTRNADLLMDRTLFEVVVQKGKDPEYDSYSAFQDDGGSKTGLDDLLKRYGLDTLVIYGIATDFCVKATAMDLLDAGYTVVVIESLCRGVAPESTREALMQMEKSGVIILDRLDQETSI